MRSKIVWSDPSRIEATDDKLLCLCQFEGRHKIFLFGHVKAKRLAKEGFVVGFCHQDNAIHKITPEAT